MASDERVKRPRGLAGGATECALASDQDLETYPGPSEVQIKVFIKHTETETPSSSNL